MTKILKQFYKISLKIKKNLEHFFYLVLPCIFAHGDGQGLNFVNHPGTFENKYFYTECCQIIDTI